MITDIGGRTVSSPRQVAQRVRLYIQEHALGPGDRMPTHERLSEDLGIGLRRLREGLSILEQQGLIETRGKGGTRVSEPRIERLADPIAWHLEFGGCSTRDLVAARARIESGIVAEACARHRSRDLLVLADAIEQMETLGDSGRSDEAADEQFHLAVVRAAHNPALLVFGRLISTQFQRKVSDRLISSLDRQRVSLAEHRRIVQAIASRDDQAAARLMYDHIMFQLEVLESQNRKSSVKIKSRRSRSS